MLIVGGGGCGLGMSIFLSSFGVHSLLVERSAEPVGQPRAHILNQRTMEIFRQHGIDGPVYERGARPEHMERIVFCTSLGGDGPLERRKLGSLDGYGGGALRARYDADSPCRATNLPLMQLEPLLRALAQGRAPAELRFHHELVSFEQDAEGVSARVRDHDRGTEYRVRARYLVAADGGKTVGRALGIEMHGPRRLRRMVNTFFAADLSPWIEDDGALIHYILNPDGRGVWSAGGLVKSGPTRWDRHSETWVLFREVSPDGPEALDETSALARVRELLRLPKLEARVLKVGLWDIEGVYAKRYAAQRIFLAGDAAHRHPPLSALGLNTAFGDAHNLAWKLALVLSGGAADGLLDTYESERQPVGARVAEWALNGFRMRAILDAAIGLVPGEREANRRAFEELLADTPGGATRRAIFAEALHIQRVGPQAHDMEIGYAYKSGALVPDGTPPRERDPMAGIYRPSTRPGSRLPHAWIERGGERVSTHDLVRAERFLVVGGDAWRAAAGEGARRFGIAIDHADIGAAFSDLEPGGALLVRPDAHIAWRSRAARDPRAALAQALAAVLRT
ncbi:MAG TPA: FAD-dependent monooxygenase [Burkholderiales bacterium]|nr:FAD-dependent monooxygenase [Burkholderiales bacterium]